MEDWLVADITVSKTIKPYWDSDKNMFSVGNYEMQGVESYFWLAPEIYLKNKLSSYGSTFVFTVHWVIMRGDTSGKPTDGPNIIMVGSNGLKIAHGSDSYTERNNTFKINFIENGWYHLSKNINDIVTRFRRNEYVGNGVSREQFLSVISDIKYILLRAKYHTDQIESSLENAVLYAGNEKIEDMYGKVEKCFCPSGYVGLSCESCDYGFVRITTNISSEAEASFCIKCDCNGHSETCNPDTGQCFCEHNTSGEKCDRCLPGYYGNPLKGTPDDCKQCACPLLEEQNNFSPSCQVDSTNFDANESGYVCTQCPVGYTGDHCEM